MTVGARDGAPAVVVKLGGTTLADQEATLREVADRSRAERLVLVHGGGKRLTAWLARMGVESRFEDGLRVTDDAALEVALGVLARGGERGAGGHAADDGRGRGGLVGGGRRHPAGRTGRRASGGS